MKQPIPPEEWSHFVNDIIFDDCDDWENDPNAHEYGSVPRFFLTLRELELEPWADGIFDAGRNPYNDGVMPWNMYAPPGREAEWEMVCAMFADDAPHPKDAAAAIRAALTHT